MDWLNNKYTAFYHALIEQAKTRISTGDYVEIHHIIPRSLGGLDIEDNLVALTAREHFVCHQLLTFMTTGISQKKMIYAATLMAYGPGASHFRISSRTYETLKRRMAEARKGTVVSQETRDKIGAANRGRVRSIEARDKQSKSAKGKRKSPETRAKMSAYWSGRLRPSHTAEAKSKISLALKGRQPKNVLPTMAGKTHSGDTREKMRTAQSLIKLISCNGCGEKFRPCHYSRHIKKCHVL